MRLLNTVAFVLLFTLATCNPIINVNIEDKCCDGFDMQTLADHVCNINCACNDSSVLKFCKAHGYGDVHCGPLWTYGPTLGTVRPV